MCSKHVHLNAREMETLTGTDLLDGLEELYGAGYPGSSFWVFCRGGETRDELVKFLRRSSAHANREQNIFCGTTVADVKCDDYGEPWTEPLAIFMRFEKTCMQRDELLQVLTEFCDPLHSKRDSQVFVDSFVQYGNWLMYCPETQLFALLDLSDAEDEENLSECEGTSETDDATSTTSDENGQQFIFFTTQCGGGGCTDSDSGSDCGTSVDKTADNADKADDEACSESRPVTSTTTTDTETESLC